MITITYTLMVLGILIICQNCNAFFVIGAAVAFIGWNGKDFYTLYSIESRQNKVEKVCDQLIKEMGDESYKLANYGVGVVKEQARAGCIITNNRLFDVTKDCDYFIEALPKFITLLNKSSLARWRKFSSRDVGVTVYWNKAKQGEKDNGFASLVNTGDNSVQLTLYDPSLGYINNVIPTKIFMQLVEEKKFDEILHYEE